MLKKLMIIWLLMTWSVQGSATTLIQLSFEELIAQSALIFEGRVIAVNAQQTGPRSIHTVVSFEILEVIKGEYTGNTIELSYLGGRVGDVALTVSEMQFPVQGETGIYFVENPYEEFIHPLVGWSQGHYLIQQLDALRQQVTTADGQAVVSIDEVAPLAMPMPLEHDGNVRGLQIQALSAPAAAMSPAAFKDRIRDMQRRQTQP
jgi:hypothetical protein